MGTTTTLLLNLVLLIAICNLQFGATSSPQENYAVCAIAAAMPLLTTKYGWTPCPTDNACAWNITRNNNLTLWCDVATHTNISKIYLYTADVNGTIPTQIGLLTTLTKIEILGTKISGTIPTQIGLLTALTRLTLQASPISGTIPTQIGYLRKLEQLDLVNISVSGTIPTQIGVLTRITTITLQSTQLCGCPHLLNRTLLRCDLLFSYPCINCSIPSICQGPCNNSLTCPPVTPLPIPSIQDIPQPSPDDDNTPLPNPNIQTIPQPIPIKTIPQARPIPSIQITPQPCSDGCHSDYGTLFTCSNGKWISSSDVVINGTNLWNGIFVIYGNLFIYGYVEISSSNITIHKNLYIQNSKITLQNCSVYVNNNMYIKSSSTITLNFTIAVITIYNENTAFLGGNLIVIASQFQAGTRFQILTSQSINGSFSSIHIIFTDSPQSDVTPHLSYLQGSLSISFDLSNNSTTGVPIWVYVIVGIVGFLLLVALLVAAYSVRKKKKKLKSNLHNMKTKQEILKIVIDR